MNKKRIAWLKKTIDINIERLKHKEDYLPEHDIEQHLWNLMQGLERYERLSQ